MKRWMTSGIAVMFVFILSAPFGMAQEEHRGFYVEGQASAAIPTAEDLQSTASFAGRLGHQMNDHIALELESGYANFNDDLGLTEYTVVPLMGNIRVHPFGAKRFDLYLLAGLGIVFADIDLDSQAIEDTAIATTEEVLGLESGTVEALGFSVDSTAQIENAFGAQIGIGALYHFTQNVAGFLEARILFASPDATGTVTITGPNSVTTTSLEVEQDLNTVFLGGGLRVKF